MSTPMLSYRGHRYPVEIINHCVWLHFRFPLSFREVEELMLERGVVVSYETLRRWCAKFGQAYANELRRRRPQPGDKWHLDEVFIRINGRQHYLWRAVDQDGNVLDVLVQSRRNAVAAKKFFRRLLNSLEYVPRVIVDEAQTGLGRTGVMYAFERQSVVPDLLTLSKTLGGGLPVAAVLTSPEVESVCHDRGFLFFTTHASDPLAAAVASTVLRVIQRDNLVHQADILGKQLAERLNDLCDRYEVVGDVRGQGLLRGLELVTDKVTKAPADKLGDKVTKAPADKLGKAVTNACLERGLHMNIVQLPGMGGIFRIAPPLTITESELHSGVDILETSLSSVISTRGV